MLTDLISLVRHVVNWRMSWCPTRSGCSSATPTGCPGRGRAQLYPQQQQWLDKIAQTIGLNLAFTEADFQDYFYDDGGLLAARTLFGREALPGLLAELNEALVV